MDGNLLFSPKILIRVDQDMTNRLRARLICSSLGKRPYLGQAPNASTRGRCGTLERRNSSQYSFDSRQHCGNRSISWRCHAIECRGDNSNMSSGRTHTIIRDTNVHVHSITARRDRNSHIIFTPTINGKGVIQGERAVGADVVALEQMVREARVFVDRCRYQLVMKSGEGNLQ